MSKTIAELVAEGKTVEEITALAEKEAAAAQKKVKASSKEIEAARMFIVNDVLDYLELLTGEEVTDEDAAQVMEEMKPIFEMWEAAVNYALTKKKPMSMAKIKKNKSDDDDFTGKFTKASNTGLNFFDFLF